MAGDNMTDNNTKLATAEDYAGQIQDGSYGKILEVKDYKTPIQWFVQRDGNAVLVEARPDGVYDTMTGKVLEPIKTILERRQRARARQLLKPKKFSSPRAITDRIINGLHSRGFEDAKLIAAAAKDGNTQVQIYIDYTALDRYSFIEEITDIVKKLYHDAVCTIELMQNGVWAITLTRE